MNSTARALLSEIQLGEKSAPEFNAAGDRTRTVGTWRFRWGPVERSVCGGAILVGALNLGGSVEGLPRPGEIPELAVELLMPI